MDSSASLTCRMEAEQILLEEKGGLRIITLNRPKKLNALSLPMISRLLELFLSCEKDVNVSLIVLKGNGKAFCAGGDAAAVSSDAQKGNWRSGSNYYQKLFSLNYVLATYKKPQVSILDGIVMGGGAGISIHGRFRVATENSVFAMPETALGIFPDVGASYFLSRLPGFFGEYLGLTGSRLDGPEMLSCGLATHYIPSERLPSLIESLHRVSTSDAGCISAILDDHSKVPHLKVKSACHRLSVINKCFSRRTVEEIFSALEKEFADYNDDFISSTLEVLKKASPTSLKISLRSMREGRLQGIGKCLVREYRMVCNIMRGEISKDFVEGCRAILFDKDRNPKWEPSTLELVDDEMIERFFSRIEEVDWDDLQLPQRSNLPQYAVAKL